MKAACIAVARKLAVTMHRMWIDGSEFRWSTPPGEVTASLDRIGARTTPKITTSSTIAPQSDG